MGFYLLSGADSFKSFFYNFLSHYHSSYTKKIIIEAFDLLANLWIYLIAGILLTTLIKMFLSKDKVASFFQNQNNVSIILASLIGVLSPLGSYIIIPLAAALCLLGSPLPAMMALLVSSPLIDPNLFLLTAGAFGYELAIIRFISAFLLGITAGYSTLWLINLKYLNAETLIVKNSFKNIEISEHLDNKIVKQFGTELFKMIKYISKYFFLAILIAAIIKIITPPELMISLFQGNDFMSVLISTSAGVPFYVCGGAAIPVVEQLADLGMSKGAVLAFFISGPVTKISNLVLMQTIFSTKIFSLYLFLGIFGAFVFGIIYNLF